MDSQEARLALRHCGTKYVASSVQGEMAFMVQRDCLISVVAQCIGQRTDIVRIEYKPFGDEQKPSQWCYAHPLAGAWWYCTVWIKAPDTD